MERVEKNVAFLTTLAKGGVKQAKALVLTASSKQLDAICEIILNVVKQVIELPTALVKKAKKVKRVIRCLAKKTLSRKVRRYYISKYLGVIRRIITAALPVISIALSAAQF